MIKEAIYFKQLKKYERRLNRNQIEIAHFIPGRIRLKSENGNTMNIFYKS